MSDTQLNGEPVFSGEGRASGGAHLAPRLDGKCEGSPVAVAASWQRWSLQCIACSQQQLETLPARKGMFQHLVKGRVNLGLGWAELGN